jgi:hypothetical protein
MLCGVLEIGELGLFLLELGLEMVDGLKVGVEVGLVGFGGLG